jgi:hypothetical protein
MSDSKCLEIIYRGEDSAEHFRGHRFGLHRGQESGRVVRRRPHHQRAKCLLAVEVPRGGQIEDVTTCLAKALQVERD